VTWILPVRPDRGWRIMIYANSHAV
jgi:hypothetical protein